MGSDVSVVESDGGTTVSNSNEETVIEGGEITGVGSPDYKVDPIKP